MKGMSLFPQNWHNQAGPIIGRAPFSLFLSDTAMLKLRASCVVVTGRPRMGAPEGLLFGAHLALPTLFPLLAFGQIRIGGEMVGKDQRRTSRDLDFVDLTGRPPTAGKGRYTLLEEADRHRAGTESCPAHPVSNVTNLGQSASHSHQ